MKPFQDGGAVTAKVKAGIKFPNPLKQFKVQQIQLKQIEYWSGFFFLPTKPCLAPSESSGIMLSCTSSGTRILPESRNLWQYPSTTASTGITL